MELVAAFQAQTARGRGTAKTGGVGNVQVKAAGVPSYNPYELGMNVDPKRKPAASPMPPQKPTGLGVGGGRAIARKNLTTPAPATTSWVTRDNQRDIDSIVGLLGTGYQIDRAGMQDKVNAIINSNGMRSAAFDTKEAALRNELKTKLEMAGIDTRAIDLQLGNMPQWQKFLDESHANTVGQIASNRNHAYGLKASALEDRKLDEKDITEARRMLAGQVDRQRRDALSDATVRGVVGSVGQDWDDIEFERSGVAAKIDAENARSAKALQDRHKDLDNSIANLNWDISNAGLTHRQESAKLNERKQLLELEAEKARLSAVDMQNAMGTALAQLGLEKAMSQGQFLEAMANARAADQAALHNYLAAVAAQQQQYQQWQEKVQWTPEQMAFFRAVQNQQSDAKRNQGNAWGGSFR